MALPDVSSTDYNASQAALFAQATQPLLDSLDQPSDTASAPPDQSLPPSPLPPTPPSVDPTLSPNQKIVQSGGTPSLRDRNLIRNQWDYQTDQELTPNEAASACGIVAAQAFARYAGRNPTVGEALQLAKQVGWTPSLGMAGPSSEVALMGSLGVHSQYNPGADANSVTSEILAGRPVVLDSPKHYWVVDDYQNGRYHVGGSGLAMRGGSEWLTWDQINQLGGGTRGSITVQSPSGNASLTPSSTFQPPTSPLATQGGPAPPRVSSAAPATVLSSPSAGVLPGGRSSPGPTPPTDFETYARGALAQIDQSVSGVGSTVSSAVANAPQDFETYAKQTLASLDATLSAPSDASQNATQTQPQGTTGPIGTPGYNDMAGASSGASMPITSPTSLTPSSTFANPAASNLDTSGLSPDTVPTNLGAPLTRPSAPGNLDLGSISDFTGGDAAARLRAVETGLNVPSQAVRALVEPDVAQGGTETTPQRLARYWAMTDPSATVPKRLEQTLNIADHANDNVVASVLRADPSGAVPLGLLTAMERTATNPLSYAGMPAEAAPSLIAGGTVGALGAGALSERAGASPQDVYAATQGGFNVGMGAGPIAEAAGRAAISAAPAVGRGIAAAAPVVGQGIKDFGAAADRVGLVPGLATRDISQLLGSSSPGWRDAATAAVKDIETTTGKSAASMSPSELYDVRSLPPMQRLPETGQYPAVQTNDGSIYFSPAGDTHVQLVRNLGIPPERLASGGWIVEGDYHPTVQSDTMRLAETARAQLRVAAKAPSSAATPPSSRFFHGTGSAFDAPEAAKFDPNGLFGPGYYLTSDARVASSYANVRQVAPLDASTNDLFTTHAQLSRLLAGPVDNRAALEELRREVQQKIDALGPSVANRPGPNVRAVNVPSGLNLLNVDGPVPPDLEQRLTDLLDSYSGSMADSFTEAIPSDTGRGIYQGLVHAGEGDKEWANTQLQKLGYDGIQHQGGKGMPVLDGNGQRIEHTVNVIFPESLPKITNAISGRSMGSTPTVGGAVLGAAYGSQQGKTPEERAKNALLYGALGAGAGYGATRLGESLARPLSAAERNLADINMGRGGSGGGVRDPAASGLIGDQGQPWYSQLSRTIAEKMPNRASVDQIRGILAGSPVKQGELAWTGLDDQLAAWKRDGVAPTKAMVTDYLASNAVDVREVVKGGEAPLQWQQSGRTLTANLGTEGGFRIEQLPSGDYQLRTAGGTYETFPTLAETQARAQEQAGYIRNANPDTRYNRGNLVLPGAQSGSYRELLLTTPPRPEPSLGTPTTVKMGDYGYNVYNEAGKPFGTYSAASEAEALAKARQQGPTAFGFDAARLESGPSPQPYQSSHFDEPNILAHVRFNDRWSSGPSQPNASRPAGENFFSSKLSSQLPLNVMNSGVVGLLDNHEVQRSVIAALPANVVDILHRLQLSPQDLFSNKTVETNLSRASLGDRFNISFGLSTALGETEANLRAKVLHSLSAGRSEQLLPTLQTSDLSRTEVERLLSPSTVDRGAEPSSLGPQLTGATSRATFGVSRNLSNEFSSADRARLSDTFEHARLGAEGRRPGVTSEDSSAGLARLLSSHNSILSQTGTDAARKKTLFIEEMQSDWAQAGRKQGFSTGSPPPTPQLQANGLPEGWSIVSTEGRQIGGATPYWIHDAERRPVAGGNTVEQAVSNAQRQTEFTRAMNPIDWRVPSTPFPQTAQWARLAFTRMTRWAVDHGYDQIAWTPGEVQNARYSLEKVIDTIHWNVNRNGSYDYQALKNGAPVGSGRYLNQSELSDHLGVDVAQKIADAAAAPQGQDTGRGVLRGLDLRSGGSGMRGFYDQILPSIANNFGKKFGARVGETSIPASTTSQWIATAADGREFHIGSTESLTRQDAERAVASLAPGAKLSQKVTQQPVHVLPITPSMRESVKQGTPLYTPPTVGGAILGGAIGSQQPAQNDQERARNIALGALGGGALGYGAGRLGEALAAPMSAAERNLADVNVGIGGTGGGARPGRPTTPRVQGIPLPPGGIQRAINEVIAPAKNTAPEVQMLLKNFANSRLQGAVDAETLGRQAKQILGPTDTAATASLFERTGQTHATPTPEQTAFAAQVKQFTNDTRDVGIQHGYINGDVTAGPNAAVKAYFPHVYQENLTKATTAARKSGMNPNDFYSNGRVFPTLDEATAAGFTPVDSFSGPLQHYAGRVSDSEAKYQLVEGLKTASPVSAIPYKQGDKLPEGWVQGMSTVPQFAGYAFPEPVARAINNIVGPSAWRGTAIGNSYLNLAGTGKQLLFSLSGFHNVTELRQAIAANGIKGIPIVAEALKNGFVPGAWDSFRLSEAPTISAAARSGVTGLAGSEKALDQGGNVSGLGGALLRSGAGAAAGASSGYGIATVAGADDQTKRTYALLGGVAGAVAGPAMKPLADALWERQVPTLKALTWKVQVAAGRSPEAAAAFVNNTYGGQNLAAIARSKTVQDTARFVFLAPDWWESWTNQLGNAFKGGDVGGQSRAYWARTAVLSAVTLEGLNYAFNKHFTDKNDPDHANQLEVTGLYKMMGVDRRDPKTGAPIREYMSVLPSPIESLLNLSGGQFTKFAMGRAGIVPRIFAQQASNKDYRGQPIVPPYTPTLEAAKLRAANVLGQISPIGVQSLETGSAGGEPLSVAGFAAATGLRTSPAAKSTYQGPQISESTRQILQQTGVNWAPSPVSASIGRIGLTRDERQQVQKLTDQYRDQAIATLPTNQSWQDASALERVSALRSIEADAVQRAQGDVAASISASEIRKRLGISESAANVKAGGLATVP